MAQARAPGTVSRDDSIYVEMQPNPPPADVAADMYVTGGVEPAPPNSPGVYDMPGTDNTFRSSGLRREVEQAQTRPQQTQASTKEKENTWTTGQIVTMTLVSVIAIAAIATSVVALADGKLHFRKN